MEKEEEEKERALSKNAALVNIHVRSNTPMRIRNPHYRNIQTKESQDMSIQGSDTVSLPSTLSPVRNPSI